MQEGQAGCSGRSGLATGTENRREMKRVKKRETLQQGGKGEKGKPQGRAKGVPPGDTSVVGQPGQEDTGSRCCWWGWAAWKGQGTWLWGEIEKENLPVHRGRRAEREGPRAGKVGPQERPKPGEMPVYSSAWNQHECWKEPSFVSSRAGREDR